jgi:hypothetical protein
MSVTQFAKIIVVLVSIFFFSSCITDMFGVSGKGAIITENRTATNFQAIELLTSANVEVLSGDTFRVEVSDYENIIQYLTLSVVSNTLVISNNPTNKIILNSNAKVLITMPDSLKTLILTGSGNMVLNSTFKDIQTIQVTGSGYVSINKMVDLTKLNATILGSGDISAQGKVGTLSAGISGSGNLNLSQLVAQNATCVITGSGNIYTAVNSTLNATITGSGNVEYSGNPTVSTKVTGSGAVIKK